MLAQALNDCLVASKNAGTPLAMKTFIVGRNRLENEGAFALSEFFKVSLLTSIILYHVLIVKFCNHRLLVLWRRFRCHKTLLGIQELLLWQVHWFTIQVLKS